MLRTIAHPRCSRALALGSALRALAPAPARSGLLALARCGADPARFFSAAPPPPRRGAHALPGLLLRPALARCGAGQACRAFSAARGGRGEAPAAPAPAAPAAWREYLSPAAVFAKVRALGPTALALYGVLWLVPFAATFGPVAAGLVAVPDPLVLIDHYVPALGGGLRGMLGYLDVELPKAGEPLPAYVSGIVWGFLLNDLVEIPRLVAVIALTPRLKAWLAARGSGGA